ncbi:MAG: peptidylprolyl isomerase [Campylobacterota bacterium]
MKKVITSVVATLMLSTTLSAADYYAKVNGDEITKQEVEQIIKNPRVQFETLPKDTQTKILDQIINKKLLAQEAIKNGITKDESYKEALETIKEDLAFQVWQQKELKSIDITDSQLKDFYEKNRSKFKMPAKLNARHILVKTQDEAEAIIKELNSASKKEQKFIELAKAKSVGPSGKKGGNLGEFQSDQMVPEFANAAQDLDKKSYSKKPVKTQFGYHVIYLNDKKPAKSLSFNEVKDKISQMLMSEMYNQKVEKIAGKLREEANIVIK